MKSAEEGRTATKAVPPEIPDSEDEPLSPSPEPQSVPEHGGTADTEYLKSSIVGAPVFPITDSTSTSPKHLSKESQRGEIAPTASISKEDDGTKPGFESADDTGTMSQDTLTSSSNFGGNAAASPFTQNSSMQENLPTGSAPANQTANDGSQQQDIAVQSEAERNQISKSPTLHSQAHEQVRAKTRHVGSSLSDRQKEPKSSQSSRPSPETTLAELQAEKASLIASFAELPSVAPLLEQHRPSASPGGTETHSIDDIPVLGAAKSLVDRHIKLLHDYNEIKDIAQGLMGLIADQRGVRIVDVQEDFGVDSKD